MAEQTGISWADATFNPWVGCAKVSPGCAHCYAETLVQGRMGRGGTWGDDGVREVTARSTWAKPRLWARTKPAELGRRPRVFCASLADVFEDRPEVTSARFALFDLIAETPELDWLVLTKRPEFAAVWLRDWYLEQGVRAGLLGSEWVSRDGLDWGVLPNLWVGTSIENSRFTSRADALREIPASVRFISAEPLLGSLFDVPQPRDADSPAVETDGRRECGRCGSFMERNQWQCANAQCDASKGRAPLDLTGIDWVIVGGESGGPKARPMHPGWLRELRDACAERGIAFHAKQWGAWTPDPNGRDGVWVSPDGRKRSALAADATGDLPDGSMRMRYAGASPTSGGKHLDGVDHCAFPTLKEAIPA